MSFWTDKKVLVTGGAGFIGSHLVSALVAAGCKIRIVDNLERGRKEYLGEHLDAVEFREEDLRDGDVCARACRGMDVVFHLASRVGGIGYYLGSPGEVILQNVRMDSNVLNAVLKEGVPYCFYASSAHVYPEELQGSPDSPPIREDQASPANPALSYGWAKLIAEKQIEYAVQEGCESRFSIARLIGIYGANQEMELATGSVIPVFSRRAIEWPRNSPFILWGTGEETRSYCFIDDAIEALMKMTAALEKKSLVGPLNIGRQERVKIIDLARRIIRISGKEIEPQLDRDRPTTIWGQWCDCTLATGELDGWTAGTSLDAGLRTVYDDIRNRLEANA